MSQQEEFFFEAVRYDYFVHVALCMVCYQGEKYYLRSLGNNPRKVLNDKPY